MPAVAHISHQSTGHSGYPPTAMISSSCKKTWVENEFPAVVDGGSQWASHTKPNSPEHPASSRYPTSGAEKTFIEGKAVARIADPLNDGDTISQGCSKTFVE